MTPETKVKSTRKPKIEENFSMTEKPKRTRKAKVVEETKTLEVSAEKPKRTRKAKVVEEVSEEVSEEVPKVAEEVVDIIPKISVKRPSKDEVIEKFDLVAEKEEEVVPFKLEPKEVKVASTTLTAPKPNVNLVSNENNIVALDYMINLQNRFNEAVVPGWVNANLSWKTAMVVEVAEAIDSLSWKWWKHQESDYLNFSVELVDIWHFLMSDLITKKNDNISMIIEHFFNNATVYEPTDENNINHLMSFSALVSRSINFRDYLSEFVTIAISNGFDIKTLSKAYIVKNCLNKFRQNHGYKEGTYIKMWEFEGSKVEDNVVAYNIFKEGMKMEELYHSLELHYKRSQTKPTENKTVISQVKTFLKGLF